MASLNQNFNAGENKGQTEEKTKQVLGNISDKAIAAKDTTQEATQAAIDKTQETTKAGWEVAQGKAGQVKEKGLEASQSVKDVTQEKTSQAKEKGSEVGQSVKETTESSGKDNTGGFLQQTGETIKGAALSATEAVKQTFGIAQNDEHNKKP
uniref:Late embryogenesis abundant protein-2 n=1 Tax=Caragana jubata TaxID=283153 RepID=F8SVN0_9FABA|nr:late embryogenesis abundant protein-2 [Caragana jubata]